ncbi:MAG: hypothetical protein QOJ42_6920, partial [Acidobacteriaceae bacterium]|nr:hypothetical protein [Acidobacteriaceae bacterium]
MMLYTRFQRRLLGGRELSLFLSPLPSALAAACLVLCGGLQQAGASTATTTTLAVASDGNKVTTVASRSVITLTATVKVGSTAVRPGQVNFC